MALYPKGDPRRPLQLAIRSTRLLGIVFILFGSLASLGFVSRPRGAVLIVEIVAVGVWLVPGVLYLICAIFLQRRQPWAVVLGLVLASLQAVAALALMVSSVFGALPAGIIGAMIWEAALGQLIYHLAKSFDAIRYEPQPAYGFSPIMAAEPAAADVDEEPPESAG